MTDGHWHEVMDFSFDTLNRIINERETWTSTELLGRLSNIVLKENLTPKQFQALKCVVFGMSYKEMATRLNISVKTLNAHINKVYAKLNVHNRGELIEFLKEQKLIDLSYLDSHDKANIRHVV